MLLHGGSFNGIQLLRSETVALMGQNHIGNIPAGITKTQNPARSNDVDFFPGGRDQLGAGAASSIPITGLTRSSASPG
jgi:hypothetical protein